MQIMINILDKARNEIVCVSSIGAKIGNAVSAMFKRNRISLVQGIEIIAGFKATKFPILPINLPHAIEISYAYKIYAYDAYVLECAKRLNAPLITLEPIAK